MGIFPYFKNCEKRGLKIKNKGDLNKDVLGGRKSTN